MAVTSIDVDPVELLTARNSPAHSVTGKQSIWLSAH